MAKKPKKIIPKKKPEKIFVSYGELMNEYSNWGENKESKKEATKMREHPSVYKLQFAFLTRIIDLLREIRNEVKRERLIK